ncbi:hypothetical protein PT974_10286 [Cladobotryum mycophilum]|uniref:CENP-V/GFA domain-containing protein n=1 Tax=Cladobotryum mycophilum TaxID=491253 RepID=A0ABR0S9E6_9HYPO
MFFHKHRQGQTESLSVFTGSLFNHQTPGLISLTDHIFVGDTIDGGASPWLQHLSGSNSISRRWRARQDISEELDMQWPPKEALMNIENETGPDAIPLRCHCKSVNFVLRRGDAQFAAMDSKTLPWFIDPTTHKHIATFDACNSCRSTFGMDILNWTFALLGQLDFGNENVSGPSPSFPQTTQQLKDVFLRPGPSRDSRFGTLAMYASSPDVQRYFCSSCSASVFYAVDDRQDLVDVAIGLLDAPEGARAESLLVWGLGSDVGEEAMS